LDTDVTDNERLVVEFDGGWGLELEFEDVCKDGMKSPLFELELEEDDGSPRLGDGFGGERTGVLSQLLRMLFTYLTLVILSKVLVKISKYSPKGKGQWFEYEGNGIEFSRSR